MSDSDVVIRVEGLGKKYALHHEKAERYTALRDVVARQARAAGRLLNPFTLAGQLRKAQRRAAESGEEEFWALKDVSFEIRRGERVGIIGRNGAGKSTLLKILSRITEPTTGRVEIRGRVASLLEVGTGFHPELTGRENIYLNGAILGMTRREIRSKFDEIVDFAEVEKFLDTPVKRYSSGMYVRLAFAVAAHLEPEILVVDEVLAVGDASFQKKCLGKMESVSEVTGRTVLFVSHNLAAISKLCTSAIALASGSAICRGRVDACIKHYLLTSAGSSQGTALAWSNKSIDLAQGIALHSCGCSQVESSDSSTLRDDKEISIWINLIIKKPMQDFQVALILVNENGEIIIHTQTDASEHFVISQQSANSSIIYRVPRGTFKRGMYFVSVYGVIPNVTRIFAHEDIIRFIVEPSSSAVTRHASSAWRGALSPCFGEWAEGKHAHIPL